MAETLQHSLARVAGAVLFTLAVVSPMAAWAQSWNLYSSYTNSFFIPFVPSPDGTPVSTPDAKRYISLTLNYGDTATKTTSFVMDTGSTGIAASDDFFRPSRNDVFMGDGKITYTSSDLIERGKFYLTDVVIHGSGSNTITAQVPVLDVQYECKTSDPDCKHAPGKTIAYMGVGFGRGDTPATSNTNPFLALVSSNVPGLNISAMRAGYVITNSNNNLNGQPGVTLGLTGGNTSGFNAFIKLPANGTNTPGCTSPQPNCVYDWSSTTASVSVNGQNTGTGNVLPDSGITYMILVTPSANALPTGGTCPSLATGSRCSPAGTTVQVSLPGVGTGVLYQFTVGASGNPSTPEAVEYFNNTPMSVNTGVGFYGAIDYAYDPVAGFVGYRWNGVSGAIGSVTPLLALQGSVAFPSGFATDFPVLLMPGVVTLTGPSTGSPGLFYGNVVGPGTLAVNSGNYWLMGATNSYTGGTIVNGGSLTLGPGATLPFASALTLNGGTFNLNGNTQVLGSLTANGGTLAMGSGMLVLNTTQSNNLASSLTGTGMLIVQGGGSLAQSGDSSAFAGATVVNGGSTLTVNGNLGGTVFVGPTGTLTGPGVMGNVVNGGLIAPGNSIGTMTIPGTFTNVSTGTYAVEVGGAGLSDRINAGTATLQGGTVVVTALPGMSFAPSTTYTIVKAPGGLTGTFDAVNELYPFLLSSLSYDASNAYLTLQIGGFAAAATTPTQYAVGAVLDANVGNATGDFATVLGAMAFNTTSNAQAQAVLQSLSGNNYAGFSSYGVQGAQLLMNNFADQAGGGGSPMNTRVALAEACDVACDTVTPAKWGAWGGGLGGLGTIGAGQPAGTVSYNAGGFAAGLDRLVTDTLRVGVTAGYMAGTQWVSGFTGNGRSDTVQTGLYANFAQDKLYADALIGYAYTWNQMWRSISIPGLQPRAAYGATGVNQFYGQVETGYRFDLGTNANAFVTPFARLQAYSGNQNAFIETGAQSLDLTVAQQQTNSLRTVLGAQVGGAMDLGWREKLAMVLRLGWSHEYADVSRPVMATLAGAPAMPFTTWGISPQRDGAVIGLSANTAVAEATSIYFRYEGVVSGQDNAHAFTAGLRMTW